MHFKSIIGSVIILYCSRHKLSNLYHRTLTILSVFDILNSTSWALHPFVFDVKGTEGLYWANGTFDTCTAGGFLSMAFALPMWLYSFYLGVYFVLTIRYQWTDRKIARYFEVPAFLVAIGIAWAGAIIGVVTKGFNPRPNDLLCLTQAYPFQCEMSDEVECIRGGKDASAGTIIASVSTFCGLGGLEGWKNDCRRSPSNASCTFLVYLNVMIWPLGTDLIYGYGVTKGDGGDVVLPSHSDIFPYIYDLISWFFFPATGLFNCMVYLRPRYVQWRLCYPQEGAIWVIWKAIGQEPLPMEDTGVVVTQRRRPMKYYNDLKGVTKALELYETRDFDSKLEEGSSSIVTDDTPKEEEKKTDVVVIEEKDGYDMKQEDEIVFENESDDDDSEFSGDDDIELTALHGAPNQRATNDRDQNINSIVG